MTGWEAAVISLTRESLCARRRLPTKREIVSNGLDRNANRPPVEAALHKARRSFCVVNLLKLTVMPQATKYLSSVLRQLQSL